MKIFVRSVLVFLTTALILTGAATASAAKAKPSTYDPWGSSALGPGYPSIVANYYSIDSLLGTEKGTSKFSFNVSVNGESYPLHLTFPDIGGFRLHSVNKGYFEPAGVQSIQYGKDSSENITMTASDGTMVSFIEKNNSFQLNIYNKSRVRLFRITSEQIAFGFTRGELQKVRLELPIASGEVIYGSGERFNEFDQVGKRLLMWNVDTGYHGNSSNAELWRGYKNVPILYSTRGYTLFYNSFYSASIDIGYTNPSKYTMDFQGPELDFYLWTGASTDNLHAYTNLTGNTLLLPKWGYQYSAGGGTGVWRQTSMYGTALEAMEKYAELGTPNIAAIYVEDIGTSDAQVYNIFNKTGTRVLKWNAPDMSLENMQYALPELTNSELPRVKLSNSPFQDSGNFIDFTMDNSVDLLKSYLSREISWGMRGGLLDFGELIQSNTLFRGINWKGDKMHNFFAYWYAKSYNEAMTSEVGNDFVFFSRAGTAGSQKYTAFFTGDQQANFEGLRQQLVGGLSASASGLSMWGGDLAGYGGTPTKEVFSRGVQFSAFQPVMRSHGTASRFPWDYGKLGESTYQDYYWLRENLLTEIYSSAIVSNKTGLPMTKAFSLAFPGDLSLADKYESYIFCDNFLVTPVLKNGAYTYTVNFPRGSWYELLDGTKVSGGAAKIVETPVNRTPVYMRSGAVIPLKLSKTLALTESMQDQNPVDALLVTIPDRNDKSTYWKNESTSITYTNTIVDSNTFRITAGKGNEAHALLVKGVAAYAVKVDGKSLPRSEKRPVSGGKAGYYIKDNGETVIYLSNSSWEKIDISLGAIEQTNLMKNASVNISNAAATIDGDWDSTFQFSLRTDAEPLIYTLPKAKSMAEIALKWSNDSATGYTLSVSENGSVWEDIIVKKDSFGGIERYNTGGKSVKYIRLSELTAGTVAPRLYEVEALEQVFVVKESKEDLKKPQYVDRDKDNANNTSNLDTDDPDAEISESDGDTAQQTIPGSSDQYIDYEETEIYFPTWAIVLIAAGAAALAGGIIFFILLKRKKRRNY